MKFMSRLISPFRKALARVSGDTSGGGGEPISLRRWEAANTDRLNAALHAGATGNSINQDLVTDLATLRARCAHELSQNAIAAGVVDTFVADVVGDGPTLQVISDSNEYNEWAEEVWRGFAEDPDAARQLPFADMLQLWVRSLPDSGEFIAQKVANEPEPGDRNQSGIRLLTIASRRIAEPYGFTGGDGAQVVLGVKRDRNGRVLSYFIEPFDSRDPTLGRLALPKPEEIKAKHIIHFFVPLEPGQVRGVPWFAPVLPTMAKLRDYDAAVLEAARTAAYHAAVLESTSEDAPHIPIKDFSTAAIEHGIMKAIPPGWQMHGFDGKQPQAQYLDHRNERHREIGRPFAMPLMIVKLDSSKHNYSSARFDDQSYKRGLTTLHGGLERRAVNPLCDEVLRTAREFSNRDGRPAAPPRPSRVRYVWTWPARPHVDPAKEAKGEEIFLANGTLSFQEACAMHGRDWEEVLAERDRFFTKLADLAGPPPEWASERDRSTDPPVFDPRDEDQEDEDEEEEESGRFATIGGGGGMNGNGVHR